MSHEVIKRVGARAYRYRVESYRDASSKKVRSRWTYLGRVDRPADDGEPPSVAPRTRRRTSETRERLIEAFEFLLETLSFDRVTAGAVAERAGVAHGTFYRYFSDKAALLRAALDRRGPDSILWGGLLFYDAHNLMHSGMHCDRDTIFERRTHGAAGRPGEGSAVDLLRVEHFDKGVPFEEAAWQHPRQVPAVTGAVMAFARPAFERLGGFSTSYIYGHYEDADLSLRWAEAGGVVAVDPLLRLVHLEGQGSRPRGEQYRAAAIVNRHLFTLRHGDSFDRDPDAFTQARDMAPARP